MKKIYSNIVAGIIAALIFCGTAYPQAEKNFDLLAGLIDESIEQISFDNLKQDAPLFFDYSSPADYKVFKNRLIAALKKRSDNLVTGKEDAAAIFNYALDVVEIKYNETFRDGLFGGHFVEREAGIKGSFNIETGNRVIIADNFEIAKIDTVAYDEIKSLSNYSLPFTRGEIPAEPFFASIWEPVIAVGTAIVTIFLFFTIRSK